MKSPSVPADPRVFISYSRDTPEHIERVLKFAEQLRKDGINANLDEYAGVPREGWTVRRDTRDSLNWCIYRSTINNFSDQAAPPFRPLPSFPFVIGV
jgi:hypothetical protein